MAEPGSNRAGSGIHGLPQMLQSHGITMKHGLILLLVLITLREMTTSVKDSRVVNAELEQQRYEEEMQRHIMMEEERRFNAQQQASKGFSASSPTGKEDYGFNANLKKSGDSTLNVPEQGSVETLFWGGDGSQEGSAGGDFATPRVPMEAKRTLEVLYCVS
eukprot:Nk52_evm5s156 gene=Nk52_evmTU5s156